MTRCGRSLAARRVRQYATVSRHGTKPRSARTPGGLPPQVIGQCLRRPAVRKTLQRVQDQCRADHRSPGSMAVHGAPETGPPSSSTGNKPFPVLGQKGEGATRDQQLPGQLLHIQQHALRVLKSLHASSLKIRHEHRGGPSKTYRILQQFPMRPTSGERAAARARRWGGRAFHAAPCPTLWRPGVPPTSEERR